MLPICVYWNTTWAHFGLRDDYGVAREAHEEPGKEVLFCGSQARPVYGYLMHAEFQYLDHIGELSWARLTGSVLLGVLAASTCVMLVWLYGWSVLTAACVGALFALSPSAQVIASWGILWPYVVSALLSTLAFVLAENAFRLSLSFQCWKSRALAGAAMLLAMISVLNYQPVSLFYLVFIAAAVVRRGEWTKQGSRRKLVFHLLLFGGAMLMAYALIRLAFAAEWLPMSKRIAFEHDPVGKLVWFVQQVLPNAFALFVLNDVHGRTAPYYQIAVGVTSLLLLAGGFLAGRRGWSMTLLWFGGLVVLLIGSYGINLLAAERFFSYRTVFPLVGVVIIFLAASLEQVGEVIPLLKRWRHGIALTVVAVAALLARWQTYELIARPQNAEYRLVERESKKLDLTRDQRVYVITPTPELAPTSLTYADEFGSLSTDSDWVPKEMMKLIFHEKYPESPRCTSLDHMVSGAKPPPPGLYDVVLDLRGLRELSQ